MRRWWRRATPVADPAGVRVDALIVQVSELDLGEQLRVAYGILARAHPAALDAVKRLAFQEVDDALAEATRPPTVDEVYANLVEAVEPVVDLADPVEVQAARRHIAGLREDLDGPWRVNGAGGPRRRRERADRLEAWLDPLRVHLAAHHDLPEALDRPGDWPPSRLDAHHHGEHADLPIGAIEPEHSVDHLVVSSETAAAAVAAIAAARAATTPEPGPTCQAYPECREERYVRDELASVEAGEPVSKWVSGCADCTALAGPDGKVAP